MTSNRQENGLPDFWLTSYNLIQSCPKFHTWAVVLQWIYDQKQLITVGKMNLSDISTVPYIRDHEKNDLHAHLMDIND
jgi:hypothetical protein